MSRSPAEASPAQRKTPASFLRARSGFSLIYLSLKLTAYQPEQSHYSGPEHSNGGGLGDGTHNGGIAAHDPRRAVKKSHARIDGQLNGHARYGLAACGSGYGSG
jgi:hypothetical protein